MNAFTCLSLSQVACCDVGAFFLFYILSQVASARCSYLYTCTLFVYAAATNLDFTSARNVLCVPFSKYILDRVSPSQVALATLFYL